MVLHKLQSALRWKLFVFQWFNSCYRSFLFHLCIILYNFLVCILYTFEFVCYIHVLCCICKIHLLAMSGFNVTLVNVQFLLSSLVCRAWIVFSDHLITKMLLLSNKNICWASYLCSCDLPVGFSRAVNFFPIFILHCTVVLVYKIKKNNDDFVIF